MDKRACWLTLCWLLGGCLDVEFDRIGSVSGGGGGGGGGANAAASSRYPWPKPHTYMTRWDKVNIDEVLNSKRLLQHYFNCLMSKGPCPPDGMELKRALPEALANACAKCTKSQIEGSVKVIRYLREFEPEKFEILAGKYDPRGIYRKKYFEPPPDDTNSLSEQSIDIQRLRRFAKSRSRRF